MTLLERPAANGRNGARLVPSADHIPEPIQWQEGMLLLPQHFQQLDRRLEELLAYQGGLASPYSWGLRRLTIDPDALARGFLRVAELEAVFPDGLVVSLPDDQPLELSLLDQADTFAGDDPVPVYLVVPRRREPGLPAIAEHGRFRVVDGDTVVDENTGQGEQRIRRRRPRLALVATREPSGDLVRLPLARIERRDNQFLLAPYEPPVLTVPLASRLGGVVVDLAARLWSKAKYLAESQGAQELEARLRVQALVAGLPLLEEVLYSDHAHPRQLYLALCAVAGPLAFLRQEAPLPPELPRYDHTDLLATFEGAARMIVDVLEEGVSELYTNYRFELEQQRNLFHLFFDPAWEGRELRLAVRRAAAHTEQETEAWMTEALIGSQSLITGMQKSRILGVARRRAEGKGDLATSSSVLLYEVNPKSKYLKTGERLLVFNPREGARPAEIVLYVRRRDAGA